MQKLIQEVKDLVSKLEDKKMELFEAHLEDMREKYLQCSGDGDFDSYESCHHSDKVYGALDLTVATIDDYFEMDHYRELSMDADKEKEFRLLSKSEKELKNILPNINKTEIKKLLAYIESQKED